MKKHSDSEDIDFESEDELGDIGAAKAKLKKLKDELEKVKKERQDYLDGWQRCKADSVNLRKESEARGAKLAEMLREDLVHDIIPALDSFDMAAASEAWAGVSDGFKSGMEYVRSQLLEALRRHGIERYGAVGETLDHALHEVIEEREDMPGIQGTIVRILRSGYKTKDKVLRPAQVFVKK